jgi:Restriction endonuclease
VARRLVDQFAAAFGLDRVEGKQRIKGKLTDWEIDAKGVRDVDGATIIVECRRKKRKLDQDALGAIAFKIQDTAAQGGIVVTPLDLQSGAERIAHGKEIIAVQLDATSTATDYAMRFFGRLMVGASVHAGAVAGSSFAADASRRCSSCGNPFSLVDIERRLCPSCEVRSQTA